MSAGKFPQCSIRRGEQGTAGEKKEGRPRGTMAAGWRTPHWPSIISVIALSGVTALIVCYSRSYSILVASSGTEYCCITAVCLVHDSLTVARYNYIRLA
jgi:hypothetical protein